MGAKELSVPAISNVVSSNRAVSDQLPLTSSLMGADAFDPQTKE